VDVAQAATNADGIAEFELDQAGQYRLEATKDSHAQAEKDITVQESSHEKTLYITRPEKLIAGEEFEITVTQKENGEPVGGADVKVMKDGKLVKSRVTNSDGKVTLALDKGTYTLKVEKSEYASAEKVIIVKEDDDSDDGGIPGFGLLAFLLGLTLAAVMKKGDIRKR